MLKTDPAESNNTFISLNKLFNRYCVYIVNKTYQIVSMLVCDNLPLDGISLRATVCTDFSRCRLYVLTIILESDFK